MEQRKGSTILFAKPASIDAFAAVGGKKECEGPLGKEFDLCDTDTMFGEMTWERAEVAMQRLAAKKCLEKAAIEANKLDMVFAGDLQAQCTASNYAQRDIGAPMVGLYGACSTMAEGLALAASFCAAGYAKHAMAMTSSHFCAAERQFRFPLEYGGKRTPNSQWTATAAGSVLLAPNGKGPYVQAVTFGRINDMGIKDINNMGAAMAPAAADTLLRFFSNTGTEPSDYDRIFTGDLGAVGSTLLEQLCAKGGKKLTNHSDCGLLLFDREAQNTGAGGSGAGCSASVLCTHILPKLVRGELKKVLFVATGALMSTTTFQQKESIPGIAHLVYLTSEAGSHS